MDSKSAATKNAMAKRRYNTVLLVSNCWWHPNCSPPLYLFLAYLCQPVGKIAAFATVREITRTAVEKKRINTRCELELETINPRFPKLHRHMCYYLLLPFPFSCWCNALHGFQWHAQFNKTYFLHFKRKIHTL